MQYYKHFLETGNFTKQEKHILSTLSEEIVEKMKENIKSDIVFNIIFSRSYDTGDVKRPIIAGVSYKDRIIEVSVPSSFDTSLHVEIKKAITHEVTQLVRFHHIREDHSFLESLVLDGMAEHVSMAINNTPLEPWVEALSDKQRNAIAPLLQKSIGDKSVDRNKWFLGRTKEIPLWTGYTIGFEIMSIAMQETGNTIFNLLDKPTIYFQPYAKKWGE